MSVAAQMAVARQYRQLCTAICSAAHWPRGTSFFLYFLFIYLMFSIPKCYTNTTCQSITQHFILYTIKIVYCQGDMFRPLLGHLQVLWENGSKSYLYFIWDPTVHWNIDSSWIYFSQRAWRWPNKGRNMSPWQYTILLCIK